MSDIEKLRKRLADAQAKSTKAMEARMRLMAGSTRARANWARAAEHRDRCAEDLEDAIRKAEIANEVAS